METLRSIIAGIGGVSMDEFYRIKRLPSYVFAGVNDFKAKARARGKDVVVLGMGTPDL